MRNVFGEVLAAHSRGAVRCRCPFCPPPMIFSKKNAGKWVASKDGKVIAASKKLPALMKKMEARKDRDAIGFDLVPPQQYFAGLCGVSVH